MNNRWFIDRVESSARAIGLAKGSGTAKTTTVRTGRRTANAGGAAAAVDPDVQRQFAAARAKYRPSTVRYLLVAESPPTADSGRFFYFEDVREKDSLFWETMKVIYPNEMPSSGYPRGRKREFLHRFQADGFYLLDAVEEPLGKVSSAAKRRRIRESLPRLRDDLRRVCGRATKVILISAPVYAVCAAALRAEGLNILNGEMIDFPGSGCQDKFREKCGRAIRSRE